MIIGELINSSRKAMRPLMAAWDEEAIVAVALAQEAAGADYIDVNCGTFTADEPERLAWLARIVSAKVTKPLCLDSPNPAALKAALAEVKQQPIINSISAEKDRYETILPLALAFNTKLIALTISDGQIPQTAEQRCQTGERLLMDLQAAGMQAADIYIDPLVQPLSVSDQGARMITETVYRLRQNHPDLHMVCGLSNISFGLPNRKLINRYFLAQLAGAGMDSFILDPTDQPLLGAYYAARALGGADPFCAKYLKAHRQGLFEER